MATMSSKLAEAQPLDPQVRQSLKRDMQGGPASVEQLQDAHRKTRNSREASRGEAALREVMRSPSYVERNLDDKKWGLWPKASDASSSQVYRQEERSLKKMLDSCSRVLQENHRTLDFLEETGHLNGTARGSARESQGPRESPRESSESLQVLQRLPSLSNPKAYSRSPQRSRSSNGARTSASARTSTRLGRRAQEASQALSERTARLSPTWLSTPPELRHTTNSVVLTRAPHPLVSNR